MSDQAWHDHRAQGIGGSEVPSLIPGVVSYGSPWAVWADKMRLLPPIEETARLRFGKRMELVLAQEFTDATDLVIVGEQTWCVDRKHPWRRCTVDGFVAEHTDPIGIWEAKTDFRPGGSWKTAANVPLSMRIQATWNAGVTGTRNAWLSVFHANGTLEHIHIPFDPEDYAYLCDIVDRFWHDHVLTGIAPPADASDATARAIAAVWAEHQPGKTADLSSLAELVSDRSDLRAQAKDIETALALIDNQIKAAIGDAETGLIDGQPAFTYRQQAGRRTECTECHHVTQGDPFRVLRTVTPKADKKTPTTIREAAA